MSENRKRRFKKRYVILAIAAIEIAALPAAAHKFANYEYVPASIVAAAEIKTNSGQSAYMVTSDGPFAISVKNLSGEANVRVFNKGTLNGTKFGDNAQMPGAASSCTISNKDTRSLIYRGDVEHDPAQTPKIKFVSDKKAKKYNDAKACEA